MFNGGYFRICVVIWKWPLLSERFCCQAITLKESSGQNLVQLLYSCRLREGGLEVVEILEKL
jgi:hypothetical protein